MLASLSLLCPHGQEMREASDRGYAWAHVWKSGCVEETLASLEKAVGQGEPDAMDRLAGHLWGGDFVKEDRARASELWRESALLGHVHLMRSFGIYCCPFDSVEQYRWLRRAAAVKNNAAELLACLGRQLEKYDQGSGRVVFELGAAFAKVGTRGYLEEQKKSVQRAVQLYRESVKKAKSAVLCWLWLSPVLPLSQDMRLLIARAVWSERAAWSERPQEDSKRARISVIDYEDGSRYEGECNEIGEPQGAGTMQDETGSVWSGTWSRGKLHGAECEWRDALEGTRLLLPFCFS